MTEGQPDTLAEAVHELANRIVKQKTPSAAWSDVLFIDEFQVDWDKKTVASTLLRKPEESAKTFEELLAARRSWIKLSAFGIWDGMLVIGLSWANTCHPKARSSILYAGFMNIVANHPSLSLDAILTVDRDA